MSEMIRFSLPDGWVWSVLGECCEVTMGQSPKSSTYNTRQDGLPFFQGKAEFGEMSPVAKKWCNAPQRIAQKADVLISVRAPVGPVNIADTECCVGRGLGVLRPNSKALITMWLFWYMRSAEEKISNMGTGTTFGGISGDILRKFPIPLPPMNKQKEIVARIEFLLGRLDNAAAATEKAKKNLQQCKNSKLRSFFNGEAMTPISDICQTSSGGTPARANPAYYGGDIPWVKCKDLIDGVITKTEEQITAEGLANSNTKILPKGTLLIALYAGSTIGRLGILDMEACTNQAICALTASEKVDTKYLFWYLMSIRDDLQSQAVGGVQLNINQSVLRQTKVWLPSPETQKEIVARIESLFGGLDAVETTIATQKQKIKKCKNSTLAVFMSGEKK